MWILVLILVVLALAALFALGDGWGPVAPVRRVVRRRRVVTHVHEHVPHAHAHEPVRDHHHHH